MVGVVEPPHRDTPVAAAPSADGVVMKMVRLVRRVAGFAYALLTNV
jgi:hypothetical protein